MAKLTDFMCTEHSINPALSTKLLDDQRRLAAFLDQEERFMPNNFQMRRTMNGEIRTDMLLRIYEAVCSPSNSDVFHLAVNLMDRYLSYFPAETEYDYRDTAGACTMISLKIRRARRECLNYEHLMAHFQGTSEKSIRNTERKIADRLKYDFNAVTVADFIHELSEGLSTILNSNERTKMVEHSLTLANVCLIYCNFSFMSVPPSLLACACICDAIQHLSSEKHSESVAILSRLANLDQDVLLEHQMHVGKVFSQKLSDQGVGDEDSLNSSTGTPIDLGGIEEKEFGLDNRNHFEFPDSSSHSSLS